ncbi:MAG: M4 family metallopeptidase, partial [Methylococcales bacterium]|nr:M4 family metallopeptidase [Methylococcales bacterium]
DWQDEIDGAQETYNVIDNMDGYSSYDGAEATMRTVNNDPGITCPNANWNGISTNYCTGVTGDDTVAHEWGHAYTEYTHGLVYAWQPGALNESYSDIWGEIVDLINGRGSDDAPGAMRTTNSCSSLGNGNPPNDNIYRWLSGEDDPAFGGAIRDMWKPECYNDPGTVSSNRYVCSTTDGGGVHTNSGVPNHAFALITDGGTFGGQTITGLGLTKAAHIYWRAQSVYQDKVSNFPDHADALEASCTDLIGIDLYGLDSSTAVGTLSGEMITAADCTEVEQTMLAVKMRNEPTQCNFGTYLLDPNSPALCGAGEAPVDLLNTNWDDGQLNGWTVGRHSIANPGSPSVNPDWVITSALPASEPGQAMFIFDSVNLGACTATDTVAGVYYLESPAFVIPGGVNNSELAFDHFVLTELLWDGGNVKVSVNSGAWQLIPTGNFTFNAYNASMNTVGAGNDNPLAGETGFTGSNPGTGGDVWGQSQVNLSGLVSPGDSVQIRFEMGLDGCNGVDGWYVDEVEAFYCDVSTAVTMSEVEATSDTASASPALLLTVSAMLATAGLIVFNHKRKDSLVD